MELWIRTQDKKRLLQTTYCGYDFSESEQKWYIYSYPNGKIGSYKSEERCFEIIDEIQKILFGTGFIFLRHPHIDEEVREYLKPLKPVFCEDLDCGCKVEQLHSYVYEMPQE